MFRKVILYCIIGLFLITSCLIFLHWRTDVISNIIKDILNTQFESVAKIEYRALRGDLWQRIFIDDLNITLKDSTSIHCAYLQLNYSLFSTVSSDPNLRSLIIDSLQIHLYRGQTADSSAVFNAESVQSHFENIPDFRIDNLEISNSKIVSENPRFSLDSLTLVMGVKVRERKLAFNLEELSCKWIEKNMWLKNLSFELKGQSDRLTVNKLHMSLPVSYFSAYAEINYLYS